MRRVLPCFYLLLASLVLAATAASAETAAQFAAAGMRAPDDPDVNGVRFSMIYGEARSVSGLDLGLLSIAETEKLSGVAFVLGVSRVTQDLDGGAISLFNINGGSSRGLNAAFINMVNDAENAVGLGFVNIAEGTTMVDIGGLNVSDSSTAQLGFINVSKKIEGFQLGFINIAENGFLPVFPFFNFPKSDTSN